jgi:hypothetical protein
MSWLRRHPFAAAPIHFYPISDFRFPPVLFCANIAPAYPMNTDIIESPAVYKANSNTRRAASCTRSFFDFLSVSAVL